MRRLQAVVPGTARKMGGCLALWFLLVLGGCPNPDDDDVTVSPTAPPINNESPTPTPTSPAVTPTPSVVTETPPTVTPTPPTVTPTPPFATPTPPFVTPTEPWVTQTPPVVTPTPLPGGDLDGDWFTTEQGDCDDNDDSVFPGAPELCDGKDNDCNELVDDGKPLWYADRDEDGYGEETAPIEACDPGPGFATQSGDCNDLEPTVNPGADETCNGVDDNCNGATDEYLPLVAYYVDVDGDGYGIEDTFISCGPVAGSALEAGDCDDSDPSVHPDAIEICDGKDSDCDGLIDEDGTTTYFHDADGDGHGDHGSPVESCDAEGLSILDDDCDDSSTDIYPGAPELCDAKDNNCNGEIDEGVLLTFYQDADGDTFGDSESVAQACSAPEGYVANGVDCNDANAGINPGADEVCNEKDDNCNGEIDEGAAVAYYPDADGDGYGDESQIPIISCEVTEGFVAQGGDCDDTDDLTYLGATEICDQKDNDCDGTTDEGTLSTFYADADGDGFGVSSPTTQGCTAPEGFATKSGDCNDGDADIYPQAPETCDGKDNDCDGATDEEGESTFYRDYDGDGYGDATVTKTGCNVPAGYCTNSTDCNDRDTNINPGMDEVCNGKDDNCNGEKDEGVLNTYYLDADSDGYGRQTGSVTGCSATSDLYVEIGGDCNDLDPAIHPNATEVCNNKDDDCDGSVDETVEVYFYEDADGDGYGDPESSVQACSSPNGYVANNTDCNDLDVTTYPSAPELCDKTDNDCDGQIDEGAKLTFYLDGDGDGYGQTSSTILGCDPPAGYAPLPGDCNDADATIHPDAKELCDSKDNDCDGEIDEGAKNTYYYDADRDGYGDAESPLSACSAPSSRWVLTGDDCNDLDASINPGKEEICNHVDDNCDGKTDDVDADGDGYKPKACAGTDCDDTDPNVNPLGEEICDEIDNDCNGLVDETDPDIDFDSDPDNCGGCFVTCGEGGEGPTCLNGSCGSLPTYQHRWKGITSIAADNGWVEVVGSSFDIVTKNDPLEIDLSIPLVGGSHSACRPTIDGAWAGSYESLAEDYIWHEGLDYTGYQSGTIPRMWTRTRVYYDVPAGEHTVAVQCRTDSGTLTAGRTTSTAVAIVREIHAPNKVYQAVSLQGGSIGVTSAMSKVPGTDLVVTTSGDPLEVTISLPIGTGGHAGCLEWMDGALMPSNPAYSNTTWYAGLESTYAGWIMWHHTRTYTDIPAGTHTFSIRCYNDSGTLDIGLNDAASVIIVKELDDSLYPSGQVIDAYGNGWEVSSGTDSRWYDLPHYNLAFDVEKGSVEIYEHLDFYNLANSTFITCRPMIDGVWAGSYAGLPFISNDEEGAAKQLYNGGHHAMWHRTRIYTDIPPGRRTLTLQCLSNGSGYYVGHYCNASMMVREVDLIEDSSSP